MKQKDYLERFKRETEEMYKITSAKNSDYADEADAFRNFSLVEKMSGGKTTTEQGLVVRLTDKLQRIQNLLDRPNKVLDEKITDTCRDLANYAIILKLYLETKEEKRRQEEELYCEKCGSQLVPTQVITKFDRLTGKLPF